MQHGTEAPVPDPRPRWLLPAAAHWLLGVSALLTVCLAASAGLEGPSPALASKEPEILCAGPSKAEPGNASCRCTRQLKERSSKVMAACGRLKAARDRHHLLEARFAGGEPDARRALAEEDAEIQVQQSALRHLNGYDPATQGMLAALKLGLTCLFGFAITYAFEAHARHVKIRHCTSLSELRKPFAWAFLATFTVASVVVLIESLDIRKSDFDWCSYCMSHTAFWLAHSPILPMSVFVSIQLSAGFFAVRREHLPIPNPRLPSWGLRPYVTFLETWSLLIVVSVGAIAAFWLHELAAQPSRTNITLSFMGWGALAAVAVLLLNIVRTALVLRAKCESLAAPLRNPPEDPTQALLGKSWWQLPSVFAAAVGIAWWLLDTFGATRIYGGH